MSSGRLFLDRVGRHQSPSPLHRRDQIKLVARSEGTIYHRTVTSALTGCLTFRDKPITTNTPFSDWGNILYNTTIATAIADRLVENSEIFLLGGDSLRKANKNSSSPEE